MWRGMIGILVAVPLLGGGAAAETAEEAPQPKCRKAEINPITGHVLCIDPLGAPVEPPRGNKRWGLLVYRLPPREPPSPDRRGGLLPPPRGRPPLRRGSGPAGLGPTFRVRGAAPAASRSPSCSRW